MTIYTFFSFPRGHGQSSSSSQPPRQNNPHSTIIILPVLTNLSSTYYTPCCPSPLSLPQNSRNPHQPPYPAPTNPPPPGPPPPSFRRRLRMQIRTRLPRRLPPTNPRLPHPHARHTLLLHLPHLPPHPDHPPHHPHRPHIRDLRSRRHRRAPGVHLPAQHDLCVGDALQQRHGRTGQGRHGHGAQRVPAERRCVFVSAVCAGEYDAGAVPGGVRGDCGGDWGAGGVGGEDEEDGGGGERGRGEVREGAA